MGTAKAATMAKITASASEGAAVTPKTLRQFGWLVGGGFLLFGVWSVYRQGQHYPWLLSVALLLGTVGTLAPRALALPYRGWMRLGHFLGRINSVIVLGVVFFTLFSLIGRLARLFGSDLLKLRFDRAAGSYRCPMQAPARDHFESQF